MYQLPKVLEGWAIQSVINVAINASIPFDPANTDYARFKEAILDDKAELKDAEGNLMSPEAAKEYVRSLP